MARLISNWFRLLRVPNLFTAPGDSLAGLFLATLLTNAPCPMPRTIGLLAASSFFAYAFGILTNDLCDLKEDQRIRPERPLPSCSVSVKAAIIAAVLTASASMACIAFILPRAMLFCGLLLVLILLYNGGAKRLRLIGSLSMGLCRGANVLLGIACCHAYGSRPLAPSDLYVILPTLLPAVSVTLIIAVVTWIADGENRVQRLGIFSSFFPAFAVLAGWLAVLPYIPWPGVLANGSFCFSFLFIAYATGSYFMTGLGLYGHNAPPELTRPAIGSFIRTLIPWQLSWILLNGSITAYATAVALLVAWSISRALAKLFPQT
ncbi:MAG: UbiA family prenyltransferase [Victivallales bacterium]|nr:UbiA family prenyltransferase [Victivallales bacterium]